MVSIDAISDLGSYDGDTISWDLGSLAPGETGSVTYTAVLGGAGTFLDGSTAVTNTVQLQSAEDGPVSDSETVTVVAAVELAIAKASTGYTDVDADGLLSPGDVVQYQLDYANSGNADATGVALSDDPDETWVAGIQTISGGGSYDGDTISWALSSLAAGASGSVTYEAVMGAAGAFPHGSTDVLNTASLSANEDGPVSADETVTVVAAVELAVAKASTGYTDVDASGALSPGDIVQYQVDYANNGNADASGVALSDDPDEGHVASIQAISDGGLYDGNTVGWSLSSLAAGASGSVTYEAVMGAAGVFTDGDTAVLNTVTLTANEDGPVIADETVTVTAAAALTLAKASIGYADMDGNGALSPGDVVQYQVSYANVGDATATSVSLSDDPDETWVVSIDAISDLGSYDGDTSSWDLGSLAPGESGSVTYEATLGDAGTFLDGSTDVLNTATLTAAEDGPITADETVTVLADAQLTVAKSSTGSTDVDGNGLLSPGDVVQYLVSYANLGDAEATGVTLTDDPDETWVAGVQAISGGGVYDGDTISWDLGSLAPGASASVSYEAVLASAGTFPAGDTTVNNVVVLSSTEDGDVTDETDVVVTATPALEVVKAVVSTADVTTTVSNSATADCAETDPVASTAVDSTVTTSTLVTYELTVSNTGDAAASAVTLDDVLPAGTTLDSATGSYSYDSVTDMVTWDLGTLDVGVSSSVDLTLLVE